jgi:hypothetical protein
LGKKKPTCEVRRRAWVFLDLSGRLHQAMAVRRHGGSMMVGMAEMAVALHLIQTIKEMAGRCQQTAGGLEAIIMSLRGRD